MSTRKKTPSPQKAGADLSESAFAYTTKEVEVKEVDFSIEINGLMGLERHQQGRCEPAEIPPHLLSAAHSTHLDGEGWGDGRGEDGRGEEGVDVVCGTKPPGFTYLDNLRRRVTRPDP